MVTKISFKWKWAELKINSVETHSINLFKLPTCLLLCLLRVSTRLRIAAYFTVTFTFQYRCVSSHNSALHMLVSDFSSAIFHVVSTSFFQECCVGYFRSCITLVDNQNKWNILILAVFGIWLVCDLIREIVTEYH